MTNELISKEEIVDNLGKIIYSLKFEGALDEDNMITIINAISFLVSNIPESQSEWRTIQKNGPPKKKMIDVVYYTVFDDIPHFGMYDGNWWSDWNDTSASCNVLPTDSIIAWAAWTDPEFIKDRS